MKEVGVAEYGFVFDVADYCLGKSICWELVLEEWIELTRIRKTTETKKKKQAVMIACRLADVAFLRSTPGM